MLNNQIVPFVNTFLRLVQVYLYFLAISCLLMKGCIHNSMPTVASLELLYIFFAETSWSFLAETFWSLKHFSHFSHSCIKTRHISVFSAYIFKHSDRNGLIFSGHFTIVSAYD